MSQSSTDFWKCSSVVCSGSWTPKGSRAAEKCLSCGTPMPEHAKHGHAVDPATSGLTPGAR